MKFYVLIRKDLSPSQQAVQGGHALAEFLLKGPATNWTNGTLVYLGVKNEQELYKWMHKLEMDNIQYSTFTEPDRNNEITALATDNQYPSFKKLQLI